MNTNNIWLMLTLIAVLVIAGASGIWTLANALNGEEYVRKSDIHELVIAHAPYTADQEAIHTRLDIVDSYTQSLEARVTSHQVAIGEIRTALALLDLHLLGLKEDVTYIRNALDTGGQ